jgi:hypothetical protein
LERLQEERRKCKQDLKENPKLFYGIWRIFPKQSLAFSYVDTCVEDVHVFAFEDEYSIEGQRKYLVTSFNYFWNVYNELSEEKRCFYEVIREGNKLN